MTGRLQGKVAIVTGAAGGIGRATALAFAREGARVLVADVADGVDGTAEAIREAGGTAHALRVDVTREAEVVAMVEAAQRQFGGLHVAHANAGISGNFHEGLLDTSTEEFEKVVRVNLLGAFLTAREAARPMVAQGHGSLIFTASVAGQRANAAGIPYSASKAGVLSLTQTIAMDLYGSGVRVNAICPGLIETNMTKFMFDAAKQRGREERIGQLCPLARAGAPEEIAAAATFLASDEASYVHGQALNVDGGLNAAHPFLPPRR